jgi:hypothetical protein
MNEPAKVVPLLKPAPAQNIFLENWKMVLALTTNPNLKFIRVLNEVASVTNKQILLRSPLALQNGAYLLNERNEFVLFRVPAYTSYPDLELLKPRFENMIGCEITRPVIESIIPFLSEVQKYDGDVTLDREGFFMKQNPSYYFKFPLHSIKTPRSYNPNYLKIALKEMLRYDCIYVSREEVTEDSPLIIGLGWNSCALIAPLGIKNYY